MRQRIKYPRTYHFPWSPGLQNDDRMIESIDGLIGKEVVATIKMDGENTTMYNDHIHARSVDSPNHPSRNWVRRMHGEIKHEIPDSWRICGENLYAKHSIHYDDLEDYFMVFNIWDNERCLSWDETEEVAKMLVLKTVPVFYRGVFSEDKIKASFDPFADSHEGYVVRVADEFNIADFQSLVAKFVRKDHVQTSEHWMSQAIIPNSLK
jgi:hypothetical protein